MAIGAWEDFTSKYGFNDGETVEDRDFKARDHLVEMLNKLPAMKNAHVQAFGYNRPGCHNPCLVILLPNPKGKSAKHLTKELMNGKLQACGLPDGGIDINELVGKAYTKARRR